MSCAIVASLFGAACGGDTLGVATTVVNVTPTNFATIPPVASTAPGTTTTLPSGAVGEETIYTVVLGDSPIAVANKFNISVTTLLAYNAWVTPDQFPYPGTKIKMIDHADAIAAMNKKYGNLYYADTIPKSVYSGMDADNKIASVANVLLVNANMPDDQAYKIVKAVFDHQKELIAVHKEYASVTIPNQKQVSTPIAFHPGAVKFIREKGGKIE